jgi:hypothetical protein
MKNILANAFCHGIEWIELRWINRLHGSRSQSRWAGRPSERAGDGDNVDKPGGSRFWRLTSVLPLP